MVCARRYLRGVLVPERTVSWSGASDNAGSSRVNGLLQDTVKRQTASAGPRTGKIDLKSVKRFSAVIRFVTPLFSEREVGLAARGRGNDKVRETVEVNVAGSDDGRAEIHRGRRSGDDLVRGRAGGDRAPVYETLAQVFFNSW